MKTLSLTAVLVAGSLAAFSAGAQTITQQVAGHNGPITVDVTVDAGKIQAVKVTSHKETQGIGSVAIEQLPAAMVKANSAKVEAVTGASVTSKALMTAVEGALAKAKSGAFAMIRRPPRSTLFRY